MPTGYLILTTWQPHLYQTGKKSINRSFLSKTTYTLILFSEIIDWKTSQINGFQRKFKNDKEKNSKRKNPFLFSVFNSKILVLITLMYISSKKFSYKINFEFYISSIVHSILCYRYVTYGSATSICNDLIWRDLVRSSDSEDLLWMIQIESSFS